MQTLRAFRAGIYSTNVHIRTVGLLYLANLLVSVILLLPLALLLNRSIGHSVVGEHLASTFDLEVLVDFLNSNSAALETYWTVLGWGTVGYLLLSAFFTGGILDSLHSPGRSAYLPRFFGGCGKFFFRFLRLVPYALLCLWGLVWLNGKLNLLIVRIYDQTVHERDAFWAMRAKQLVMLVLLMLLGAVLDTARIQAVQLGSTRMTARFFSSVFLVLRHLPRTLALYSLITVLGLVCFLPYLFVAHTLLSAGSVIFLFLVQQIMMYVRIWWRLCLLAAQMSLVHTVGDAPTAAAFASVLGRTRLERLS